MSKYSFPDHLIEFLYTKFRKAEKCEDVEDTVSFFNLKSNPKWNRPRPGTIMKKIEVFEVPRALFMGGCSYLGLRTQEMLENPNPLLTDHYYRQLVQFPQRS